MIKHSSLFARIFFVFALFLSCVCSLEDNHELCAEWAQMGECDKNPGYMLENCAQSCHEHAQHSEGVAPDLPASFYDIVEKDASGTDLHFSSFKGKVVYIVNTASYCGYTKENFDTFRKLAKYRKDGLEIVIAPCNQFGYQEPGDATAIGDFARKENFEGIILAKADVNGASTRPLFQYLKHHTGTQKIEWNFDGKFLVDSDGHAMRVYDNIEGTVRNLLYGEDL